VIAIADVEVKAGPGGSGFRRRPDPGATPAAWVVAERSRALDPAPWQNGAVRARVDGALALVGREGRRTLKGDW
jgi:hypothetical protein